MKLLIWKDSLLVKLKINWCLTKSQCFKNFCEVTKHFEINVENDNIVLTLSNVAQINFEIDNIDSTLFNVVNFKFDIHNIVSTLIWRCMMSQRHINLKTTLKKRWNVYWVHFGFVNDSSMHTRLAITFLKPTDFQLNMYITWRKLIFLVL